MSVVSFFSYLIRKYVQSALQQGTMNSKRTGWTIGRGQRDPIANAARARLFVYDGRVICHHSWLDEPAR